MQSDLRASERVRTFYENPLSDINIEGAPIVYPLVTEYNGDNSGINGKIVYKFRYSPDSWQGYSGSSKFERIPLSFDRGQLLSKRTYKKTSEGFVPVKEEGTTYNADFFSRKMVFGGLLTNRLIVKEGSLVNVNRTTDWYLNPLRYIIDDDYPVSQYTIQYDQNDTNKFVKTESNLNYTNGIHQLPTSKITTNSLGQTITQSYRYPSDFILNNTSTGYAPIDTMLKRNMNDFAIESWAMSNSSQNNTKCIGSVIDYYSLTSQNTIQKSRQKYLTNVPIPNYTPLSISSSGYSPMSGFIDNILMNQYDSYGNIQEQQKSGDVKEVYLWGYNGQYPVAKVIGSDFATVNSKVTQSVLTNSATTDVNMRTELAKIRTAFINSPLVQVWTYTYKPLVGMTSETNPQGVTTYYEYDGFGRLMHAKDKDGNIVKKYDYHYSTQ